MTDDVSVPLKILKEGDQYARLDAAETLAYVDDLVAVLALVEALKDEEIFVRIAAAEALQVSGDLVAVPGLIEAIVDGSSGIFDYAVYTLWKGASSKIRRNKRFTSHKKRPFFDDNHDLTHDTIQKLLA